MRVDFVLCLHAGALPGRALSTSAIIQAFSTISSAATRVALSEPWMAESMSERTLDSGFAPKVVYMVQMVIC